MVSWKSLGKLFGRGGGDVASAPNCQFALALHRLLRPASDNAVSSPESVRMALGMALLGARGATTAEIAAALHVDQTSLTAFHAAQSARLAAWSEAALPYALEVANGFFHARSFDLRAEVATELRSLYRAQVEALDFARDLNGSIEHVNRWVANATRALIPEIVGRGSLRADSRLVIANAVYFKGEWASKFMPDLTIPRPFTLPSGDTVSAPTMHQTAEHRVWMGPDVEVLEMAYRGGHMAMLFAAPKGATTLGALESELREESLQGWIERLEKETLRVAVPRFAVDLGSVSLRQPLVDLRVTSAFDAAHADFSGFGSGPLALDDIAHRARLTVTEEGTEAAAATVMIAAQSADRRKLRSFVLDRPFLFLLRDVRDGTILFLGRVTDPRP